MGYSGFISVMRSRWLRTVEWTTLVARERERNEWTKARKKEGRLAGGGRERLKRGWNTRKSGGRWKRSVLTCILYAVCCEFTALNYHRSPRGCFHDAPSLRPRKSTPLARLCMPGTRLTHKLTLCSLHFAGPGNSSRRRLRSWCVINLQVNAACRGFYCYPESRKLGQFRGLWARYRLSIARIVTGPHLNKNWADG